MNADRVWTLVMLASSPNENEARTAAFLACKAIREEGLLVLAPDDPRLRGRAAPPPPPRPPPPPPREPPRSNADAREGAKAPGRKRITLRFPGFCRACRQDLPADTAAWWAPGAGTVCEGCHGR